MEQRALKLRPDGREGGDESGRKMPSSSDLDTQTFLPLDQASSLLIQWRVHPSPSKAGILHLGSESIPLPHSRVLPCYLFFS